MLRAPLHFHALTADSLVLAHEALGHLVQEPAQAAIRRRLANTPQGRLIQQIRHIRAAWDAIERRTQLRTISAATRRALREYRDCLHAWTRGVGLAPDLLVDGAPVLPEHLALWAQDDNTGCQTGMLRVGEDLLFWHSEEDSLGGFDLARLVQFIVPEGTWYSFQYPYLLPGPAFGWSAGQIHAVDSLYFEHRPGGVPTSLASWLVWRVGAEVPNTQLLRDLTPYCDGCVIVLARPTRAGVVAASHAIGGDFVHTTAIGKRRRDFYHNNALHVPGPMTRGQRLPPDKSRQCSERQQRADLWHQTLRARSRPGPSDILEMLADRSGSGSANANSSVVGHCIARLSPSGIELHVGAGPAHPEDPFTPQWQVPYRPTS